MLVVVENIGTDPLWKDIREAAASAEVSACWSQPITALNGEVLGAMALYNREPAAPTQNHMDGLEISVRMVGLAVESARFEEQQRHTAKMEALGMLAGGIAHDFNNLLVTILGNAELALLSAKEGADHNDSLKALIAASLNARDLCNQMLIYAGRGSVSPEVLDCNSLVKSLGSLLQVSLSKKATLEYDLAQEKLGLLADSSQLGQVVMNLITTLPRQSATRSARSRFRPCYVPSRGARPSCAKPRCP
ncbi:MAG: two-component system cell cycle sensor histidine kinase/response regulator CckA [Planctomycetota bacterium]|jgi:two-component system cell cycle sensor histidine kinase/response regulator CckA